MTTGQPGQTFELSIPGWNGTLQGDAHVPPEPRAVIGIVHGLGEHHGRYDAIAAQFSAEGFAVYKYDHPGHGKSDGARGHAASYNLLLAGLERFLDHIGHSHPDLPILLWGHSMGGGIVINYLLRDGSDVVGTVATAPFLSLPTAPPKMQMLMGRVMNRIYPSLTQTNGIDTKYLSRDPAEVKKYEDDPLVHPLISVRLAIELFAAGDWALDHANELSKPLLIMHGTQDRLTSHRGSRQFAERAGEGCTYLEYADAYHELHFDIIRDEVLQTMLEWMNTTLSASAS